MTYFLVKVLISAVIVAVVSEVARRSSAFAALIASLPLTSLLAMVWLYHETRDVGQVSALAEDVLWLVLPSLVLFIVLPLLLKRGVAFYPAMGLACLATAAAYGMLTLLLRRFGLI
ncbi:MAG TPA: DUF3147 family protein [Gammaproteobacteria bacterium]|nr:DUF3147 family protein [Gammaproteobacteria bacterium]